MEPARVIDLCLLEWASALTNMPRLAREHSRAWLRIIDTADTWVAVDFPLSGRDARDLGLAEGPQIAEVLKHVENWWTSGGCRATATPACAGYKRWRKLPSKPSTIRAAHPQIRLGTGACDQHMRQT